jgi:hypothetical protein
MGSVMSAALLAIVAPDIKHSFGGEGGATAIRVQWRIGEPNSELWAIPDDILRHGGRFTGPDGFVAPYTFTALPDSLDAFEHLMVREADVPVHAARDRQSAVPRRTGSASCSAATVWATSTRAGSAAPWTTGCSSSAAMGVGCSSSSSPATDRRVTASPNAVDA